jgi:hypothetical protein
MQTNHSLTEAPSTKISRSAVRCLIPPLSSSFKEVDRLLASTRPTMSSSDEDYVADDSDDGRNAQQVVGSHGTRSTGPVKDTSGRGGRGGDGKEKKKVAAWENISRSWDVVIEGADGSINSTVESISLQNKRKRCVFCIVTQVETNNLR